MNYYTREELELMTTYELRDICYEEKIVNGMLADFDKDEYIYQIMRFRGRKEHLLISEYDIKGNDRLSQVLKSAKLDFKRNTIRGCAKLICYENLSTEIFDNFTIGYEKELVNTNAVLVNDGQICAIFNIKEKNGDTEKLYITKSKDIPCFESNKRSYSLYCMDRATSDLFYSLYYEDRPLLPKHISFSVVEVLDFEVRKLKKIAMPLAIDFGTSNTTAGLYLDDAYFEEIKGDPNENILKRNHINYVYHLDNNKNIVPTLPTIIGVISIADDEIEYIFGYEASRIFQLSHMEDGFSVFYDIKRFVSDPEKEEEIIDKNGHRSFIKRKELIKAYLEYIIDLAKQRFKCDITHLHISSPVKQKKQFQKLFKEILPSYIIEDEIMLDEGVAVLYNTISSLIESGNYEPKEEYKALIIDCGGGTTDLSSCSFSIESNRVSYKIDIKTAYENGDTDFGGNNLTFRIMQLLKIGLVYSYTADGFKNIQEIMEHFDIDLFRAVDEQKTTDDIYKELEEEYKKAEDIIPTRFKDYEHKSIADYYAVKSNFYYLFDMAEKVKKEFYKKTGTLRIGISTVELKEIATKFVVVNRWRLYVRENNLLVLQKDIPTQYLSIFEINLLLKADIYNIVKKFIGSLYEDGSLAEFSILKLTGQSCKIDIFREALKEFIPGKLIESTSNNTKDIDSKYELKLSCVDGAIQYLKDVKFGYADIAISSEKAAFPYIITAFNHEGKEKELLNGNSRKTMYGHISRNMADVTLKLFLKDSDGNLKYTYNIYKNPKEFFITDTDEISAKYKGRIVQDDLDDIIEREMKFFLLPEENSWGFIVVAVYRLGERIYTTDEEFLSFETDGWLSNFFDGTR